MKKLKELETLIKQTGENLTTSLAKAQQKLHEKWVKENYEQARETKISAEPSEQKNENKPLKSKPPRPKGPGAL